MGNFVKHPVRTANVQHVEQVRHIDATLFLPRRPEGLGGLAAVRLDLVVQLTHGPYSVPARSRCSSGLRTTVDAQTRAATHPRTVQPNNRVRIKIAPVLW